MVFIFFKRGICDFRQIGNAILKKTGRKPQQKGKKMLDSRSVTNEELVFLINAQMKDNSFNLDVFSRSCLIGFLDSIKDNTPKNMSIDSYYKIKSHITRLRRFKELQETQLSQFKEVLIKY